MRQPVLSQDGIEEALSDHISAEYPAAIVGGSLDPELDLLSSGLIDSMGVMQLVAFMEEDLGLTVADDEIVADNFRSLRALTAYVGRKKGLPVEREEASYAADFRRLLEEVTPPDSLVLVVSHGDDALLGRCGWHFPRDHSGQYAGYSPATGAEAIEHLEALRSLGATHLAFPDSSLWWLDHYGDFRRHLEMRYAEVGRDEAGVVYGLAVGDGA